MQPALPNQAMIGDGLTSCILDVVIQRSSWPAAYVLSRHLTRQLTILSPSISPPATFSWPSTHSPARLRTTASKYPNHPADKLPVALIPSVDTNANMTDRSYPYPGDDFSRYGGATSHLPKLDVTDLNHAGPPPPPGTVHNPPPPPPDAPWYDPRGWSLRTRLIAGAVVVVVIVAVIVGAVEGTKANRYPDYAQLDYKLVDTYSGTEFLERFNYFSDEDPTNGFVQYVPLCHRHRPLLLLNMLMIPQIRRPNGR